MKRSVLFVAGIVLAASAVSGSPVGETMALQARIDAAAAAGGGEVRVPAGDHRIGGLLLRSGVTLHLEKDAHLIASCDPKDFEDVVPAEAVQSSAEACMYRARRWENAIIRMFAATNVALVGELGSWIDGGNCADLEGEEGYRGPHGVSAVFCTNVTLTGYTLRNTGNWAHRILCSENVTARNLCVQGGHDGFDIHHTSRVRVADSFFDTGDDCIAGFDDCDVVVSNCVLHSACSPVRLGGRDVLITDCTADGGSFPHRWTLSWDKKRKGLAANLREGRRNMGCFFQYFADDRDPYLWTPDNMVFRNVVVRNADLFACALTGLGLIWNRGPGIANVRFENVRVENCRQAGVFAMPADCPLKVVTRNCSFAFREKQAHGFDVWNATFENAELKTSNLDGQFALEASAKDKVPVPSTFPSWTDNDHVARRMLGLEPPHLVDAMIAGREPKKAREMFVDFYANASNLVFKANPDFWGAKLDFSCFPVWNTSKEPHSHGGTLISPWHVLFSKHWYLGKGNALYFRDRTGKVLKRGIADVRHVGGTDLTVGLLQEPVNGIEPARVLATNEISRLSKGEPVVVINQDKYATVADLRGFGAKTDPLKAAKFGFDRSHDRQREGFFVRVRSNDSSSPSFLVDEKGLVLVGLHWEVGEDANIAAFTPVIQKLMDELHPGCSLRYR